MNIKYADTFFKKFKGLMFIKNFDYILKIKCNGIHTFFMKCNIDVILTDKDDIVLYIYKDVRPWRVILPKKYVVFTYELPCGYLKSIKIGDSLKK